MHDSQGCWLGTPQCSPSCRGAAPGALGCALSPTAARARLCVALDPQAVSLHRATVPAWWAQPGTLQLSPLNPTPNGHDIILPHIGEEEFCTGGKSSAA